MIHQCMDINKGRGAFGVKQAWFGHLQLCIFEACFNRDSVILFLCVVFTQTFAYWAWICSGPSAQPLQEIDAYNLQGLPNLVYIIACPWVNCTPNTAEWLTPEAQVHRITAGVWFQVMSIMPQFDCL